MVNNETHKINTIDELNRLLIKIDKEPRFAAKFIFSSDDLYTQFLNSLDINPEDFNKKYYHIDKERNLHIAESSNNYIWISTMGLVAKSNPTDNKYVNSCLSQIKVTLTLLEKAKEISSNEKVYDIDSYESSQVDLFTVPLYHSITFCLELIAKAYLSIFKDRIKPIHKISQLLKEVEITIKERNHSNTLFEEHIYTMLQQLENHLSTNPTPINEAFIKYYDNIDDITLISFNPDNLSAIYNKLDIAYEIITSIYYFEDKSPYLQPYNKAHFPNF